MALYLSRLGDYGVRIMLAVAVHRGHGLVIARRIAKRHLIPSPFMRKIIALLVAARLLETRRGRNGGLMLGRPPQEITLKEVVEALEGPMLLNRCLAAPGTCPLDCICPARPVWRQAQQAVANVLGSVTLADLAAQRKALGASARQNRRPSPALLSPGSALVGASTTSLIAQP
ncbi:MAG: Rrf2 family transcriptional regulator [Chloroflexi bacterium]|nr:Rrf2 family transcriptional regulator [Chloroflexota bacterium]